MLDHNKLALIEKRTHLVNGEAKEPKGGSAARFKVLDADPKRDGLRIGPRRTHLAGHAVPEAVFAAVEDAVVDSEN